MSEAAPYLRLITLGGTIAASQSAGFSAGGTLLRGLRRGGSEVRVEDLRGASSTQMTLAQAMTAMRAVRRANADDAVRGVVVSMGTGTMEEVAFLADLVVRARKAIVFTGAMDPPGPNSDGPMNLGDALDVADLGERLAGVFVCMAGEVHEAASVGKLHSSRRDAFRSAELGPLAVVEDGGVRIFRPASSRFIADITRITCRVEVLTSYVGMGSAMIDAMLDNRPEGLVVEAFGSGQVPPPIVQPLRALIRAGTVVTITSRARAGRLRMFKQFPFPFAGDEKAVHQLGAIFADLPAIKARLQIAVALSAGLGPVEIARLIEEPYALLERR
jgi:L-asparaginase